MKVSVVVATNSEVVGETKNQILNLICSQAYKNGLDVVCKFAVGFDPNLITKTLKICRESSDSVVFVCDTDFEKSYVCKRIVCEEFSTKLVVNQYAKQNIEEVLRLKNVPLKKEDQTFMQLPETARCIKNPLGVFQGFLIEDGSNKSLFFLPFDTQELYRMFFSSVLPYILQKKGQTSCTYVFKTFGISYGELCYLLKDQIKNKFGVQIVCMEYLLEGEVIVFVPQTKKDQAMQILGAVYTKILPYIFSDTDSSLPEMVAEILQVRGQKMVVVEDFTCGKIASTFFEKISFCKDILAEGIVALDESSKINLLNVSKEIFETRTLDYSELAYEMALGGLQNSNADITIATCGDLKEGKLVFALGSKEGIHVFDENVFGTNTQKVEMATNVVLLKLLKKLKKDDFNLGEVV